MVCYGRHGSKKEMWNVTFLCSCSLKTLRHCANLCWCFFMQFLVCVHSRGCMCVCAQEIKGSLNCSVSHSTALDLGSGGCAVEPALIQARAPPPQAPSSPVSMLLSNCCCCQPGHGGSCITTSVAKHKHTSEAIFDVYLWYALHKNRSTSIVIGDLWKLTIIINING